MVYEDYIAYFIYQGDYAKFICYYCHSCAKQNNIHIYVLDDIYPIDHHNLTNNDIELYKINNLIYYKQWSKLIHNTLYNK